MNNSEQTEAFSDEIGKQFESIKKETRKKCPDSEVLNQFLNRELPEDEKGRIENHIDLCPECLNLVNNLEKSLNLKHSEKELQQEWQEAENEIDNQVYQYIDSLPAGKKKPRHTEATAFSSILEAIRTAFGNFMKPTRFAAAGAAVALFLVFIYSYTFFSRPDYFEIAQIKFEKIAVNRSVTSKQTDFTKGLEQLNNGNYASASRLLKNYQQKFPEDFQANYYTGLSLLFNSDKSRLGLKFQFDEEQVKESISYLKNAFQLAQENQFYREDCLWYLGKAYLRLGNLEMAKQNFSDILQLNQSGLSRQESAKKLLTKIAQLEQ